MFDDLLDFAEKKLKGRGKRKPGYGPGPGPAQAFGPGYGQGHGPSGGQYPAPGQHPAEADPRSRGGLRSMIAEALDGDFGRHDSHGRGYRPSHFQDDSSDDRDHVRSSRRRSFGGWDD